MFKKRHQEKKTKQNNYLINLVVSVKTKKNNEMTRSRICSRIKTAMWDRKCLPFQTCFLHLAEAQIYEGNKKEEKRRTIWGEGGELTFAET